MSSHESRRARGRWRQAWSDRVHAAGDAAARRHGWTITITSTRSRFRGRVYRDPRFGTRNLAGPSTDQRRAGPGMLTGWTQQRRTNRHSPHTPADPRDPDFPATCAPQLIPLRPRRWARRALGSQNYRKSNHDQAQTGGAEAASGRPA
jgi:hypothetical protein